MAAEDEILSYMRMRGPVLPADIERTIKTSIIFAGAHLSELASRQKVRISSLKVGGSPLYYIPGHEAKLLEFTKNLDEKEVRALNLLQRSLILRDGSLEPLTRVALRNIKDFAVPLTVTMIETQELFWKYYLISDEDATVLIKEMLEPPVKPTSLNSAPPVPATLPNAPEQIAELLQPEMRRVEPVPEMRVVERSNAEPKTEPKAVEPVRVKAEPQIEAATPIAMVPEKKVEKKTEPVPLPLVAEKIKKKKTGVKPVMLSTNFSGQVRLFFDTKGIKIVREDVLRKDAEISYVIEVPSAVGYLRYLCHARNKKKCTDKDLSGALVDGQMKRMPVVFLYPGDLTPKAEEMMTTDTFKMMVLYKLGN